MKSVLFVCLGNICRSPIAEGVAKKIAAKKELELVVDSAGTGSWHIDEAPCANSIKVAKQHRVDISGLRGRRVAKSDFNRFDLIVALDQKNYSDLEVLGCKNLVKLGSFGFDNQDVPDPFFFDGFEGFDKVFDMIEKSVMQLIDEKCKV